MHQKVFDNKKKKEENNKKNLKKKQEIGHNFLIDFLFFILHEKSVYTVCQEINGQTQELAQDDWLESLLAEEASVTVVVNHFLLLRLHWGRVYLKRQNKTKKPHTHKMLLL